MEDVIGVELSNEDEAPEDISLSQSKDNAHERRKMENEAIKHQKDARKNARRKRQTKLIEQKEAKKTKTLERLPDEIIEILSSVDQQGNKAEELASCCKESNKIKLPRRGVDNTASIKTREDKMETRHRRTRNGSKGGKFKTRKQRKGKNLRKVCILNEKYKPKESKAKKGKIFLKEQLYGDRIKRVDSISARSAKAFGSARPKVNF